MATSITKMNVKIPHKTHCYFCGQAKLKLNTLKMQTISWDHRARYIHIKLSETHQLFNTILFFPHYVHISCEGNDLWDDHFFRLKKMSLKHYFARKECAIVGCTAYRCKILLNWKFTFCICLNVKWYLIDIQNKYVDYGTQILFWMWLKYIMYIT